jgi:3-oxoadipate enol-lactonase
VAEAGTVALHHRVDGPPDAPLLVLGPSIGTDLHLWDANLAELSSRFRVLRFDTRGHGRSPAPAGPYTTSELAADVLALVDHLGVERFAYCGVSLGGAVGQQLALDHGDRLTAVVLCCTAAKFGDADDWNARANRVRAEGTEWLVEPSRTRWFSDPAHPDAERMLATLRATPAEGYAGCCEALAGFDTRACLDRIATPTRVLAGADDPATPPDVARQLADGIDGADLVVLPRAAHLATAERPTAASQAILDHLRRANR